jgi:glycosyltransferase involved in cell wall biosynthesis
MEVLLHQLPKLAVIVPSYNESLILKRCSEQLSLKLKNLILKNLVSESSFIVFIDDGSNDNSLGELEIIKKNYGNLIQVVPLAKNFGHQTALIAGYEYSLENACEITISVDADLQHDISCFDYMIEQYTQLGFHIVCGIKRTRGDEKKLKKIMSNVFYKFAQTMKVPLLYNHADFRLLSNRALENLLSDQSHSLFVRSKILQLGFDIKTFEYDVLTRIGGDTKYTWLKMFELGTSGIISNSIMPLRLIFWMGIIILLFSLVMMIYTLQVWVSGKAVPGWSSVVMAVYFLGSVQLIFMGIIGEYLSKTYHEVKRAPRYLVKNHVKVYNK